jgi:glyoxylase-like metal-dependent hydrolase (beta-lactamase superfamily II)
MLVDGGPANAYPKVGARLAELVGSDPLDLLVLTHIDGDHIEGLILLTNDADLGIDVREVWYNGSGMLTKELGAVQGEILAALIQRREIPWNVQSGRHAICMRRTGHFRPFRKPVVCS